MSCCLNVDMLVPLPTRAGPENMDTSLNVGEPTHHDTHNSILRKFSRTVFKSYFVSGGTESVGTPHSERSLSDRRKKAA